MSTAVALKGSPSPWEVPSAEPFDEAVWQAWLARGRAHERRGIAARATAVKWVSIVGLLVSAALWSHLATYEVAFRFVVAAGAIFTMFHALGARHYAFAAVFGALAVLYNPVVPLFGFSGDWHRTLLVASALPFIASLAWRKARPARND
jgi:hypothetical protein